MGFIKKNLLKVIEWEFIDDSLVHKYEIPDRYEIMNKSKLIVRESQAAIFMYQGQIADVFTAGTWTLETDNTPILSKLAAWKYAWEMPNRVDIYFVNLKQFIDMKWGTANPIMMRDKDFGMIRLLGHGEYAFHVCNPSLFLRECLGTVRSYSSDKIHAYLKDIVLMELTDLLGECQIPALDLASNYRELGDTVRDKVCEKFGKLGVAADEVIIKNLKLPEAVEQAMDKRTTLGVIGDQMSTYAQYESVGAMRDAAKNPGAGGMFAGIGVGLGAGTRIGAGFADNLDGAMSAPAKKTVNCAKCGAKIAESAKFCPECGSKNTVGGAKVKCGKCGHEMSASSKFCPECGTPTSTKCPGCGKDIKGGVKFCPECGQKLN